jgi:Ca2+-binding RTX toxin-like protein
MPRQSTDRDTTWETDANDRTWALTVDATISTDDDIGILDAGSGNRIKVLGGIQAENTGVQIDGAAANLFIGKYGAVVGWDLHGVLIDRGKVVNHGSITSGGDGVRISSGSVENHGRIEADRGIVSVLGSYDIENSGSVRGWDAAVDVFGAGRIVNTAGGTLAASPIAPRAPFAPEGSYGIYQAGLANLVEIINEGRIIGGSDENGVGAAIVCQGRVELTNTGTIIGNIMLGDSADRVDTRGGVVRGNINGGEGDDLYLISSADIRIVDNGASFADTVRSTVSYTLTGGLDHLKLLGKDNISANGNGADNDLIGNEGDNTLAGWTGEDLLSGGAGNDILSGGLGADQFEFRRGFDVDRITDFANAIDRLQCDGVDTQKQFNRLDVRQAGANTIIDFGQGDRLILENFDIDNLDLNDFAV